MVEESEMAFAEMRYKSAILGKETEFLVILPDNPDGQPWKVLYLLHGLSDDSSAWVRYTGLERYVRAGTHHLIVMPDAGKSFYTDMARGEAYETFLTKELPEYIQRVFPISKKREDTFIAGLSMGGYGAFKLALKYPGQYAAAASFSGALDMVSLIGNMPEQSDGFSMIYGDLNALKGSQNDLFALLEQPFPVKPKLLQTCGTEDFLYQYNLAFRKVIETKDFDYQYIEKPGTHNWDFWDDSIRIALDFFDII